MNIYTPDLLRVVRRGLAVKDRVDAAIDQCSVVLNLRDSIEEERARAENSTNERQRRIHAHRGASLGCVLPFHDVKFISP